MIIEVCVGSSCHLKGSEQVVELLQHAVDEHNLSDEVTLCGSFCMGRCNREGVTVRVDDEIITGVTKETFKDFFENQVLAVLKKEA
ncbi:MAG: (2Fe-2S) ferredoxin domain-containing protein [Oscillospiraceae bacterium]|nr:(2Fe-2S) ferredoxin domain-containing protein [Oscillospiraceae bacterium]